MFCPNCGEKVKDDWNICPKCGKQLLEIKNQFLKDNSEKYYNVRLEKTGDYKVKVIGIVKEQLGILLNQAKDIVDSSPCNVMEKVSIEVAKTIKEELEAVGATVSIIESSSEYATPVTVQENVSSNRDDAQMENAQNYDYHSDGEFRIFGDRLIVSDGRRVTSEVRVFINKLANEARQEFATEYQKLGNIEAVVKKATDVALKIYIEKADVCVEYLMKKGIYSVSSKDIVGSMSEPMFDDVLGTLQDWYIDTLNDQQQKAEYRRLRKESRSRWTGMGFGTKAAAEAQAQANVMNIMSGMAHGMRNAVGNTFTAMNTAMSKSAKYNDENTVYNLSTAVAMDIYQWNYVVQYCLNEDGIEVDPIYLEDEKNANNIFQNLKRIVEDNSKQEVAFQMAYSLFDTNPTEKEYYEYCIKMFPSEQEELILLGKYLGLDMTSEINEYLDNSLNRMDVSTEALALVAKEKILEMHDKFGVVYSSASKQIDEILKRYDEEARTYNGIIYSSREKKCKAEAEDNELHERFPDEYINCVDETKCISIKEELTKLSGKYTEEVLGSYLKKVDDRINSIWAEEDKTVLIDIVMKTEFGNKTSIQNSIEAINSAGRTKDKEKYINVLNEFTEKNVKRVQKGLIAKRRVPILSVSFGILFLLVGLSGWIASEWLIGSVFIVIGIYLLLRKTIKVSVGEDAWNSMTADNSVIHPYLRNIVQNEDINNLWGKDKKS